MPRDRLEPVLGPLRVIDPGGGPVPLHDFEADLPGGSVAAIEVTSQPEAKRLDQASSAQRRFSALTLPGSGFQWLVGLNARARVNAIRPGDLRRLLSDMETEGRRSVHGQDDYRDPFVKRLRALRIESVYSFQATGARRGGVVVSPGVVGSRGWNGATTGAWLEGLLASPQGVNKLRKLDRAFAERHLVIMLYPESQAGLGIPTGLMDLDDPGAADSVIPSFVPPEPLTDLWLIPTVSTWPGLRWTRSTGWAVLT